MARKKSTKAPEPEQEPEADATQHEPNELDQGAGPGTPPEGPFAMNDPAAEPVLANDGVPVNAPNAEEGEAQAAEAREVVAAQHAAKLEAAESSPAPEGDAGVAAPAQEATTPASAAGDQDAAADEEEGAAHEPAEAEEEGPPDEPRVEDVGNGRFLVIMAAAQLEERGGAAKVAEDEGWRLHGCTVDPARGVAKLEVEGAESTEE